MRYSSKYVTLFLISLLMISGMVAVVSAAPEEGPAPMEDTRGTFTESGDETHSFKDARELFSGDAYYGDLNRVDDRGDYFYIDAVLQEVINVHIYVVGHDGTTVWQPPDNAPPTAGLETTTLQTYLCAGPNMQLAIDGAFNYFFTRHYCLNICGPVPGTNSYYINVSIDWFMTNNNYTWEYMLELEIETPQVITSGGVVSDTIDVERRDTHWYKIYARFEDEVNGSFEILNFNSADPTERNVNIWMFPDDLGGYPFSYPWDWSAAPNEPKEPINVLSTYEGWFFIKLRGMNHTNSLPCTYRLEMHTKQIPEWPDMGVQNVYFDRFADDTDWYKFDMKANQPHQTKPGYWNDVVYFNMTERADAEDLPDFDVYLFGRVPGSRWLDLLDSSFRNDHPDFYDENRDPNKNTEEVRAAAFYNGTYYVEVNAFNNTGFYDMRREWKTTRLSDMDNLPENAVEARAGVYSSNIHQAFDHYDWYKVEAKEYIRAQFDSFKGMDMFNLSIYKYDANNDEYVFIKGGWNTWFNFSTREDNLGNLIDVRVRLADLGLGAGTYHIAVFAAVAAEMAFDETTNKAFIYKTQRDAEANYELRIWIDDAPPFNRPPQVIKPIPDLTVPEDTDKTDYLDLYDFYKDTDVGDQVLRFRATIQSGKLKALIQEGDTLGFLSAEDYSGRVVVRVTAIDSKFLQTSMTWNITFESVNDPPSLLFPPDEPYIYTLPEDTLRQFDFKALVKDVDKGDTINITFEEPENLVIDIDPDTLVAELNGKADWFGEEIVDFTASDDVGDETPFQVKFVVENVDDNPIVLKPIGEKEILEDTTTTIPLREYFSDPDGDTMMFTLSANPNVGYSVDDLTGVMTLTPDQDFFGFRDIWITAVDTTGRSVQTRFIFIVQPVNDDPEIKQASPSGNTAEVNEQQSQSFVVLNVTDPEFSVLIYTWYLDGTLVGPSNFYNYKPSFQEQGTHELKVVVTDEEGATDEHIWTVTVNDVPRPPTGGVASPVNNAKYYSDEKIQFVALFYDLDGDQLSYQWYIDNNMESSESTFDKKLSSGDYQIRLVVSAGEQTVNKFMNITVEQVESPGFSAPLVMVGLGVGFMAAAAWRRRLTK